MPLPLHKCSTLLLTLFVLQGCDTDEPQTTTEAASVVSVVRAEVRPLASSIAVTGTLAPRQVVLVHTQTPGLVVTELLAEEGQTVRAGQILAHLSSERQRAELAGSRGELHRAEQALARAEALAPSGAMTRSEADAVAASHAEALARVRALEIDLARTEVRAPVAGLLQRRNIEIGEAANDQPLFEIAADSAMELVADLSEAAWRQVRIGQSADITLAEGQVFSGHIRRLSGALDSRTRLGRAWISLDNPPAGLVSGQGATARLQTGGADLLALPQSSLLHDQLGAHVFLVRNGKAVRQDVILGERNSEYAEIVRGLNSGDAVVARAGSLLRDGDAVVAEAGSLLRDGDGDPVRIATTGNEPEGRER
ncbi:efflux RND transporter periplasmic adaptor subunit [Microbulbifer sp.]|uniref:efflux RND transporter periplasmic adaptor subunit n=1 Tax=Microbulbifer sp. TaxID=1908541 RepID=UPI003F2E4359